MHKEDHKSGNIIISISILLISNLLLLFEGCRERPGEIAESQTDVKRLQSITSEVNPLFVKYRSFQNPDSTWGYTIFVNSRPYLHYTRIPLMKNASGFMTKKDADMVAAVIVKMIQNGDMEPKLSKSIKDSLELKMQMKE
jgi:hypothetical protein